MNLKINHIQHIGIPVSNMDKSITFYERLGFKNVMPSTFEIEGEKGGIVAMMERNTMIIELYQLPASHLPEIKNRKDGHIDHIAFDVDDIVAEMVRLKNEGFIVLNETPKKGADNKLVAFLHPKSTNGVLIELCQEIK